MPARAETPSQRRGPRVLEVHETESGQRLDRFVRKRFPRMPLGLVHKLARKRQVTVDRKQVAPSTRLSLGERVEIWTDLSGFELPADRHLEEARRLHQTQGFRRQFHCLYEDSAIIVLDKPGGLVVHPSKQHRQGDTLLDLLRIHLPESFASDSQFRPAFVHRLDRGTSGAVVAAKTRESARAMERMFRQRKARKVYRALVAGKLRRDKGSIDLGIEKGSRPSGITRYRAAGKPGSRPGPGARRAVTRYRVLGRLPDSTLLEIEIGTGRTHQIRVHFAALGHPVVGDGDYGERAINRRYRRKYGLSRLFLHAAELEFPHPLTGERMIVRAPLPEDLRSILEELDTLV